MKCEEIILDLPSLLYGELSEDERERLMSHISGCQDCRDEWEEMKTTEAVMMELGEEEPPESIVFIAENTPRFRAKLLKLIQPRNALKWGLAAAAALVVLWIFKPSVSLKDGDFRLAFGRRAPVESVSAAAIEGRLQAERIETLKLMSRLLVEQSEEQRRDYTLTLTEFARSLERQRRDDLRLIGSGLENVNKNSQVGLYMTNMRMEDLIKNASYDSNYNMGK